MKNKKLKSESSEILPEELKSSISNGSNIIGFILIMMAGWIDTVGLKLYLNQSPIFMSGRATKLGHSLLNSDFQGCFSIMIIVIAFIFGAILSTLITRKTGLIGGLVFSGIIIILASFPIYLNHMAIGSILIPMAMGGQNAATSLTMINRTTHLTGPTTDIGINIAKGNWKMVRFWTMRWIGFPLGSMIGIYLIKLVENNVIRVASILIIPGIMIILTGIIQKIVFDIQLLD